jgi:signal transduction histidine kinase
VFNLLKNAIKHNRHGGQIHIELLQTELRISNTGSHNEAADSRIFDRFVKGAGSKSLGLGLAIVRKICELYQIDACYSYHAQLHQISIQFQPEKPNDNNVVL